MFVWSFIGQLPNSAAKLVEYFLMRRWPPAKRPAAAPHKSQALTLSRSLAPQIVGTAGRMTGGEE